MRKGLGLAFIGLLGLGVAMWLLSSNRHFRRSNTNPFVFEQSDVVRLLRKRGISTDVVDSVLRNASGDELFVLLPAVGDRNPEAVRITTNAIKRFPSPGRRVFAPADDHFGAWLTKSGDAVAFRNGASMQLPEFALFDLDPSGHYFVVGEKPSRTWIGRAGSPDRQQLLAEDVLGSRVFARGDHLYVCGTTRSAAVCLLVVCNGDKFTVTERHTFEWAAGIVDVDPEAHQLLLWNNSDLLTTAYVYDLTTKRRHRVGSVKGFEMFLTSNLLDK